MKRTMNKYLFLILLPFISSPALAEWTKIPFDPQGVTTYVDKSSIERAGNLARMWVLIDFGHSNKSTEAKPYRSTAYLWEFNCTQNKRRPLEIRRYTDNKGMGSVTVDQPKNPEWQFALPQTIYATVQGIACTQ